MRGIDNKNLHVKMYDFIIERATAILDGKESLLDCKIKFCEEKGVKIAYCFEFAGNEADMYCKGCPLVDCLPKYVAIENAKTKEEFIKAVKEFRDAWK